MESNRTIRLRWLHGAVQDVTHQLAGLRFSRPGPHAWRPAINAYRCEKCITICVDLAGAERSDIDLATEPQRLSIRGARGVPEPRGTEDPALHTRAIATEY